MTILLSIFGMVVRFAAAILTTTLGWASTLLFGRVQRSHQMFVVFMLGGSLLWLVLIVAAVVPPLVTVLLSLTPHPSFLDQGLIATAVLVGILVVPLGVGLCGYLVPSEGDRPTGLALARELLRGYVLTPILGGLLVFLPGVGISRKARSVRHGWSDVHIPIVVKPDGYDTIVTDLQETLRAAGIPVHAEDAPRVLSVPAWILTRVAGPGVRKLRADRLVELEGKDLRIGIYPSDIAISGPSAERARARAAVLSRLATTAAHLTSSAEAQAVEDRIEALAGRTSTRVGGESAHARAEFAAIDRTLLDLPVTTDEWDILYRIRLQIERDLLLGAEPGSEFPSTVPTPKRPVSTKPAADMNLARPIRPAPTASD
jgi:hypothetical protein